MIWLLILLMCLSLFVSLLMVALHGPAWQISLGLAMAVLCLGSAIEIRLGQSHRCNDSGGVMLNTMSGWQCVHITEGVK